MIQPNIILRPGLLMAYGASIDTEFHKHHMMQIIWPDGDSLCTFKQSGNIADTQIAGPLLINTQIPHQLRMTSGWVILFEPKSTLGIQLCDNFTCSTDFLCLNKNLAQPNQLERHSIENPNTIIDFFAPLLSTLGLDSSLISMGQSVLINDQRIQNLINELDVCLVSECLKPSHWSAAEVANKLSLSESRFLHLFRQEMNIPWRPYLLWRRMICAILAMVKGHSATEAAHTAGFSDSAHLSRTFRAHFGMTIRDAQALLKQG